MSDALLVAAAKRGERSAFDALCEHSAQRIYRTAFRVTRNREDAEDAVQDTFLKAFVHLKDFDGRSSFSTWLTRIAINSSLMLLRKKRLTREVSFDNYADPNEPGLVFQIPDAAPGPESRFAQKERDRLLWQAISTLRPSVRKVVELQLARDCAMKETAKKIGISVCAAKSRLFHAKAAIRKSMTRKSIGGAPMLRSNPRFYDGAAAYRKVRSPELP
ncbi:MAG TPA: sigma-70 family RNA polymerase sigma factor [Candidatus Acidoferrales bacterium]